MILNHLWGLYAHPQAEWRTINASRESLIYGISHILVTALVPTICCFFSAVYLGWHLSLEPTHAVSPLAALVACMAMYVMLVLGVMIVAIIAWRSAVFFGSSAQFVHAVELAAYAATPLFISGFCALYPELWFILLCGIIGIGYSVYLLFSGIPILINLAPQRRRWFSLVLIACGLSLLFTTLATMIWVWELAAAFSI